MNAQRRYETDPAYRALVDAIATAIARHGFTIVEAQDAALLAALHVHLDAPRRDA